MVTEIEDEMSVRVSAVGINSTKSFEGIAPLPSVLTDHGNGLLFLAIHHVMPLLTASE